MFVYQGNDKVFKDLGEPQTHKNAHLYEMDQNVEYKKMLKNLYSPRKCAIVGSEFYICATL